MNYPAQAGPSHMIHALHCKGVHQRLSLHRARRCTFRFNGHFAHASARRTSTRDALCPSMDNRNPPTGLGGMPRLDKLASIRDVQSELRVAASSQRARSGSPTQVPRRSTLDSPPFLARLGIPPEPLPWTGPHLKPALPSALPPST
jgi:hypothetical protein